MQAFEALVVASYGRGALVARDGAPRTLEHCAPAQRRLRAVCGDRVRCVLKSGSDLPVLETVLPRRNVIERIDSQGRAEPVAANIDRLAIIAAPLPTPDWFVVDRYHAAARLADVPALLVLNKSDMGWDDFRAELASCRKLFARCLAASALEATGIAELRETLGRGSTLLVGQSGVGKSTLINSLIDDAAAQTSALTREAEGRHTTSAARRYAMGAEAALIDAPGVRDFAPPSHGNPRAAEHGFAEVEAASVRCRFGDCRHFDEPNCAVRSEVAAAAISARRYESYRRLARLYQSIDARRYD
jgi:ribosome biogenesis GTPase / thiamine phosphate phosphatase